MIAQLRERIHLGMAWPFAGMASDNFDASGGPSAAAFVLQELAWPTGRLWLAKSLTAGLCFGSFSTGQLILFVVARYHADPGRGSWIDKSAARWPRHALIIQSFKICVLTTVRPGSWGQQEIVLSSSAMTCPTDGSAWPCARRFLRLKYCQSASTITKPSAVMP